jgi:hypothetical protein
MKNLIELLTTLLFENWLLIGPVIYEFIARLWPTRWNVSILDAIWKVISTLIPNTRKPDGTEQIETDKSGQLVNKVKIRVGRHIVKP